MYGMKGQSFMESLKRRIEKDGVVIGDSVIKVDSFLNHQMDIAFLKEVGAEFANIPFHITKKNADSLISALLIQITNELSFLFLVRSA